MFFLQIKHLNFKLKKLILVIAFNTRFSLIKKLISKYTDFSKTKIGQVGEMIPGAESHVNHVQKNC